MELKNTTFPLVYYRMPNEKDAWFLQSEENAREISSLQNMPAETGFILYPFSLESSSRPLFIQAYKHIQRSLDDLILDNINWNVKSKTSFEKTKTKEEYCRDIASAVDFINTREIHKVVLSRMKLIDTTSFQNPLEIFTKLCNKYPAAFISLVYIPGKVLWITATPELLVSASKHEIKTVSLAGTKPANSTEEWGEKEKMEQQIVTDYIHGILKQYCENVTVSDAQEAIAGNVKHLKSSFSAILQKGLWSLVSALHPTPAVCGIPLAKAEEFIARTEQYNRKYYAGFLGPCNVEGNTNLFVNLRCAEVFTDSVNLYIGGGITGDSIPEKEWEETELKSRTLLAVLQ